MLTRNIIELNKTEYLSDYSHKLPQTPGIHLVLGSTGIGKTYHMLRHCEQVSGTMVPPVKAIIGQQNIEKQEHSFNNTKIVQLEKLSPNVQGALHIDEAQLLYQGGFRSYIEQLIETINNAKERIPVYLYSAKVYEQLLSHIHIDSITQVRKPFNRNLSVIQFDKTGEIKNCENLLTEALAMIGEIDNRHVLVFINSRSKGQAVAKRLNNKLGYEAATFISSDCLKTTNDKMQYPEQYRVYQHITTSRHTVNGTEKIGAIGGCGYKFVIATDCLSEGININDNFHCVALQSEPSKVFQQLGRARNEASYWLICGEGLSEIMIENGDIKIKSVIDNEVKLYTKKKDESKLTERCKWANTQASANADLFNVLCSQTNRGAYGAWLIREMADLGYVVSDDLWGLTENAELKTRISGLEITKRETVAAARIHGCPFYADVRHPLYQELLNDWELCQLLPVQKLTEWKMNWEALSVLGLKLDWLDTYTRVNQLGRRWLVTVFTDKKELELADEHINDIKQQLDIFINSEKANLGTGRISSEHIKQMSDLLWNKIMPDVTEYEWWQEHNDNMRETLFKLLFGFELDGKRWILSPEKSIWQVTLSPAEHNRVKARTKHIEHAGGTVQKFCEHLNITNKDVAAMKTKDVKHQASNIIW